MLRTHLKRWIFFLIIAAASLVIGLRTSVGFFLFFFWFIVVTGLLTFLWLCCSFFLSGLSMRIGHLTRVDEDDILEIKATFTNTGLFPLFNTMVQFELPFFPPGRRNKNLLVDFLLPGSSAEIVYRDVCYKRGKYVFGNSVGYFFDPFGIFYLRKRYRQQRELYVYPRIFPVKKMPPLVKGNLPWFGIAAARSYADEDDFYGIREYRTGDPLRTIHWMSTARQRKLIVKQFQRLSFFRATVIFNLEKEANYGEGKETVCEYIIRIVASVAKHLIERNVALQVLAHVGEIVHIEANKGPEHLEEILKFLTLAMPESQVGLGELVQEFAPYIADDANLIVVMIDKDWDKFLSAITMERTGSSLIPVVLLSSSFMYPDERAQEYARELKVKLYRRFNFNPIVISCGDRLEETFAEA